MLERILLAILLEHSLLRGLGEGLDEQARLLLTRLARDGNTVPADLEPAFRAAEHKSLAFGTPTYKIDA